MNSNILEEFKKVVVQHARLEDVYEQMKDIYKEPDGERVCVLVGPTGVGKSKLVERIHKDCLATYRTDMEQDAGIIPSILHRASSPTPRAGGRVDFDWKDAFIRILETANEVLIRRKVVPKILIELDGEFITDIHGLIVAELRRSLEQLMKNRKVRQLVIDEAGHIFVADMGKNYRLHFELVKSMAIEFQRPLILSGSFDLLRSTELNGQLNRRIKVIHFPRYTKNDFDTSENRYGQSFRNALHTFLERIPIPKEEGLIDNIDYFLMKSLGCMGLLKEWLERTLQLALKQDEPMISRALLEQSAIPNRRLKSILREIKFGEEMLQDVADEELAKELGLKATPSLSRKLPGGTDNAALPAQDGPKGKLRRSHRVGMRNPSRDPVGGM